MKITQQATLDCVVDVIVQKAAGEAGFSAMYASLVARMVKDLVLGEDLDFVGTVRQRSLGWFLSHRRLDVVPSGEAVANIPEDERQEAVAVAWNNWKGMVTFIAELYKQRILEDSVVDELWQKLQQDIQGSAAEDEDAETLCTFLTAAGESLEERRDDLSGEFYECLKALSVEDRFSTRIRFMAEGLLELRKAKWVPRRAAVVNPKKLSAQHASIVQNSLMTTPKGKFSPSTRKTPSSASSSGASPATPASNEKWDRAAWEEEMARSRKNRLKGSPAQGAWVTPLKTSPATYASKVTSPASYASKVKETPQSSAKKGESDWNRAAWEEEMARERQLRVERERKTTTTKNTPKHSGKQQVQILKRIQQPGPK